MHTAWTFWFLHRVSHHRSPLCAVNTTCWRQTNDWAEPRDPWLKGRTNFPISMRCLLLASRSQAPGEGFRRKYNHGSWRCVQPNGWDSSSLVLQISTSLVAEGSRKLVDDEETSLTVNSLPTSHYVVAFLEVRAVATLNRAQLHFLQIHGCQPNWLLASC